MTAYSPTALRRFRTIADDLRRYRDELGRAGDHPRVATAAMWLTEATALLDGIAATDPGRVEHFGGSRG